MDEKLRLTFWPIFDSFSKMKKVAENGRKVKAAALLYCQFSPRFQKSKKWLKTDEKLRLQPYIFSNFCLFQKSKKTAQNGRKLKAIALLYCTSFCLFSKIEKVAQNG
jgi:hypothetical protein